MIYNKIKQYLYNKGFDINDLGDAIQLKDNLDGKGIIISEWKVKGVKKPSKTVLNNIVFDPKIDYRNKRIKDYPSVEEQLDMIYHDKRNGTTTWTDKISEIKAKYPKP